MWKLGLRPDIPLLGIFVSNFRHFVFAVWVFDIGSNFRASVANLPQVSPLLMQILGKILTTPVSMLVGPRGSICHRHQQNIEVHLELRILFLKLEMALLESSDAEGKRTHEKSLNFKIS
jgi:hypothetical protein